MDQETPLRQPSGAPFGREGRRLSVIMFTDMVGYSALAQRDEALALALLEEHRAIVRPILAAHAGNEIKTIGDAFLVEFSSALEATSAAVEIQRAMHERNGAAAPGRAVRMRIGLHAGDVIYRENDILGDGVNIASRIEPLAEPGGICLSEDVVRQVRSKMATMQFVRLGAGELKNIATPVDVYRVALPWVKSRPADRVLFLLRRKSVRRAIGAVVLGVAVLAAWLLYPRARPGPVNWLAVLPLHNVNAVPGDEYFADGLTEELISTLATIRDLNVIARTSVAKFRETKASIAEIGAALNVGSILEGSVSVAGNQAKITVNLVEVRTGRTIWSQVFTPMLKDVFAAQSSIAMNVSSALKVRLVAGEQENLAKPAMASDDAAREYLRGRTLLSRRTGPEILQSIVSFTRALEQDPKSAYACAGLAEAYTLAGVAGYGTLPRVEAIARAKEYAARAVALDGNLAEAHAALAYARFRIDWDWPGAETEFKRALGLKPGVAHTHELYGLFLAIQKRLDESLAEMRRARELDPISPSVNNGVGRILHFQRRYEEAIAQFRKVLEIDPQYAEAHFSIGISQIALHRYDDAIAEMNTAIRLSGNRQVMLAMVGLAHGLAGRTAETRRIFDEMRTQAGATPVAAYYQGLLEVGLGDTDAAMSMFEKAYDERDGTLIYLAIDPVAELIWAHPRFPALVRKLGLQP